MINKIIFHVFILLCFGFKISFCQGELPEISSSDLMSRVEYLSSWELRGRLAGSEGYNMASTYAAEEFRKAGLKNIFPVGYFQNFNVEYNEILKPVKLNLFDGKEVRKFTLGDDYVFRGFTGSGNLKAPVAFCGYGISQPESGYDDYKGIDVKGKIVIVFKSNPKWKINDAIKWVDGLPRIKAMTASEHGALAILFVSFPNDANPQKTILSVLEGDARQNNSFPMLHIDIPVADLFLRGSGYSLKDLQTKIDSNKMPSSLVLETEAEIEVHNKYFKDRQTQNVIAFIEGSDPVLKDEYLVIGAHLDHTGSQAEMIYTPGANDNASGSAAVIEIGKTFLEANLKPKRSIIFILFSAEESGLLGSEYFTENSPVPAGKIVAMFNLDCIGYGDSIQVGNGKSSPELWNLIKEQDSLSSGMMVRSTWGGGGADATPFHQEGIPCAYFVTTNSYEHLHYMTDKPETLNKTLYSDIVNLVFRSAVKVSMGLYSREIVK